MENLLLEAIEGFQVKFDEFTFIKIGITVLLTIAVYVALVIVRKRVSKNVSLKSDLRRKHFYITVIINTFSQIIMII